jgi:hypothetical protein
MGSRCCGTGIVICVALTGRLIAADGLLLHLPLAGDARDVSPTKVTVAVQGGDFDEVGPTGQARGAMRFDGRGTHLEIAADAAPKLGTGDATWAVWAKVADADDDLPGDILSHYDPVTRTGYRWGIDTRTGVTSTQANRRNVHFGIDRGQDGEWVDHGRVGRAMLIFAMAVHDSQLFAGTCEAELDGAGHVFRYDGITWHDCGSPGRANSVTALAEFDGSLYAATGKYRLRGSSLAESENPHLGGAVYRYRGDGQWEHCGQLPEVEAIGGLVVFRNRLYAGSLYKPVGFFRYDGGTAWTSCGTPDGKRVNSLAVHNGAVYATGYDEGAVYRYDGETWSRVGLLPEATQTYGFAVHRGELYVSEWPHASVYRYAGGSEWVNAGRLGEEKETMPLAVYNGKLYGGTLPLAEVYRYDGPTAWTMVARLDHTPDVVYRRVWTMAVYRGRLFAGTLPSGHVHSVEIGRNVTHDRPLPAGWRHLAVIKRNDRLQLFVDGEPVATSAPFRPEDFDLATTAPLQIGTGSGDYFHGALSDLRIYRRALSETELRALVGR